MSILTVTREMFCAATGMLDDATEALHDWLCGTNKRVTGMGCTVWLIA